jgi:TctA family transporter
MPSRAVSDIALGAVLLVAAALALWDTASLPGGFDGERIPGPGLFPRALGALMAVLGLGLLLRPAQPPPRWSAMQLLVILGAIVIAVVGFSYSPWSRSWFLQWGPPEYTSLRIFELAVAVALARASYLRALAMAVLGFILSIVGIDAVTGQMRLTFGIEALYDGIDWLLLAAALFVVAEAAIILYSPEMFRALYARQVRGWMPPVLRPWGTVALRLVAVAALGVAVWYGYELSHRVTDLALLFMLGAFGVACRLLDWNRVVLMLAFSMGVSLEESVRQALLLSQGDPGILLRPPLSLGFLVATGFVVAAAAYGRFRLRKANPQ